MHMNVEHVDVSNNPRLMQVDLRQLSKLIFFKAAGCKGLVDAIFGGMIAAIAASGWLL